jgi:hypothetical protein
MTIYELVIFFMVCLSWISGFLKASAEDPWGLETSSLRVPSRWIERFRAIGSKHTTPTPSRVLLQWTKLTILGAKKDIAPNLTCTSPYPHTPGPNYLCTIILPTSNTKLAHPTVVAHIAPARSSLGLRQSRPSLDTNTQKALKISANSVVLICIKWRKIMLQKSLNTQMIFFC